MAEHQRLPFEVYDRLFRELKSYANADGYCVCSTNLILRDMGKVPAMQKPMMAFLVKSGCIEEFVSTQVRLYTRPISFYKLTGKDFTREVYEATRPPKRAPNERAPFSG